MNSTSRRSFIRTSVVGSAALAFGARLSGQPAKLPPKPNLLVFLPDQLRADTVTGRTSSAVHVPNLHALASQSVAFESAYVTQPICVASRSSLFTGTWPHVNGAVDNQQTLSLKYKCLPELLADTDFRTGFFGKWHLGDELSAQRGFQEWVSTEEYAKSTSGKKVKGQCDYTKFLISKGCKPHPKKGQTFDRNSVSKLPFDLSKPKFLETRACDFLERHRQDPFVLFVAFYEPHPPYNGPFNSEHPLDGILLDESAEDFLGEEIPLRYRILQERLKKRSGVAKFRQIKQKYLGLITEIDHAIGAILTKLEKLSLSDRTTVVLTSDHGDMMGAHGLLGKRVMFEESARVPYLVRVPGQRSLLCNDPISHIDFMPTMLDLLGKSPHPQCVGRSRTNLIRGENATRESVFSQWCSPTKPLRETSSLASADEVARAISESTRTVISPDGWKLSLRDKDKNELYNLREDPGERKNLYSAEAQHPLVSSLTDEIHRWQERESDTLKV